MLFADAARAAGLTGYYRPAALNTHPLFIEALAHLVQANVRTRDRQHTARERLERAGLVARYGLG
jgi:hypothetical protein